MFKFVKLQNKSICLFKFEFVFCFLYVFGVYFPQLSLMYYIDIILCKLIRQTLLKYFKPSTSHETLKNDYVKLNHCTVLHVHEITRVRSRSTNLLDMSIVVLSSSFL